jgi:hypothetical protein
MPLQGKYWAATFAGWALLAICFGMWGYRLVGPYMPHLNKMGWAAVGGALVVVATKFCMNILVSKNYKAHEQGYDNCVMVAGAAIPAAAAAILSKSPRLNAWLFYAGLAFFSIIVSAALIRLAEESPIGASGEPGGQKLFWTGLSLVLALIALPFYVLLIVLKAQQ